MPGQKNCPGIGQTANYKGAIVNPEAKSNLIFMGSSFPLKKMSLIGTKILTCKGVPFGQNFLTFNFSQMEKNLGRTTNIY
jgi:hypothetical protein